MFRALVSPGPPTGRRCRQPEEQPPGWQALSLLTRPTSGSAHRGGHGRRQLHPGPQDGKRIARQQVSPPRHTQPPGVPGNSWNTPGLPASSAPQCARHREDEPGARKKPAASASGPKPPLPGNAEPPLRLPRRPEDPHYSSKNSSTVSLGRSGPGGVPPAASPGGGSGSGALTSSGFGRRRNVQPIGIRPAPSTPAPPRDRRVTRRSPRSRSVPATARGRRVTRRSQV
jgi:hypothetical protein